MHAIRGLEADLTTISRPIQADPVITKLLDKVPADMRGSFTDEQLLAL